MHRPASFACLLLLSGPWVTAGSPPDPAGPRIESTDARVSEAEGSGGSDSSASELDAERIHEILVAADRARGNLDGVRWELTVVARDGGETQEVRYEVAARGYDVRATGLSPRKYRGHELLMVERNMWFHKPGLSKPVPISRRQRLMGEAAYGDVAATSYAEDYDATRVGTENIDGIPCHVFSLEAKSKSTTYDLIRYWISIEDSLGIEAEFYTVSGKRMKTARMKYENRVVAEDGAPSPFISTVEIRDAIEMDRVTVLHFDAPRFEPIDDSVFSVAFLGR